MGMVQVATKITTGSGGELPIMADSNYGKVDCKSLELRGEEIPWGYKYLKCLQGILPCQHITEPARARGTDDLSIQDIISMNNIESKR